MMQRAWLWSIPVIAMGLVCGFAFGKNEAPALNLTGVHPEVFHMVTCWISDTVQPVVTEISLDAIETNHNQFDFSSVKRSAGWTECPVTGGEGFRRFKPIQQAKNQFVVEYQENTGGTLTTTSNIECSLESRDIRVSGQLRSIRVMRVHAVSSTAAQ
jgi:hypothetical protein